MHDYIYRYQLYNVLYDHYYGDRENDNFYGGDEFEDRDNSADDGDCCFD